MVCYFDSSPWWSNNIVALKSIILFAQYFRNKYLHRWTDTTTIQLRRRQMEVTDTTDTWRKHRVACLLHVYCKEYCLWLWFIRAISPCCWKLGASGELRSLVIICHSLVCLFTKCWPPMEQVTYKYWWGLRIQELPDGELQCTCIDAKSLWILIMCEHVVLTASFSEVLRYQDGKGVSMCHWQYHGLHQRTSIGTITMCVVKTVLKFVALNSEFTTLRVRDFLRQMYDQKSDANAP